MSILQNLPVAEQVRDATQTGENTAARVGGLFVSIIQDAAQDIDALHQLLAALPAQPFDDAEFHSTDNTGQEQSTGDQTINFKCNGAVVKALLIKVATSGYSGLMSAEMADKLEQLPDSIPEMENIASDVAFSANASDVTATVKDANDDWREPQTLPMMATQTRPSGSAQSGPNITGAIRAGILTAAFQNVADLYGQGIELYINGGTSATVILAGAHLYRGDVLEITELDGAECSGVFTIGVQGLNYPIFNSEQLRYSGDMGEKYIFDLAVAFDQMGFNGEFGIVNTFGIVADSGRNMHIRVRVIGQEGQDEGNFMNALNVSTTENAVIISGRNYDNQIITSVTIPAASSTKAGMMTASDKNKLAETVIGSVAVGSLGITQTTSTVEVSINDATQQSETIDTYHILSATTTAAGVMSASDKNKLNGIAAGAEVNTLSRLSFDATTNPESAQTEEVDVVNKVGNLDGALSGGFVVDVIPIIGSLENRSMPKNGTNYHLGSISTLAFDNNMAAMTLGCTIHFTAVSSFIIVLPYAHEIGGVPNNPRYGARMADSVSLSCTAGEEYELDITTICSATGQPINVFALHNLITPDATSNGLS